MSDNVKRDLHQQYLTDLSSLVDGELDEIAARRAMAHVKECPDCRRFFEEAQKLVRLHQDLAARLANTFSIVLDADVDVVLLAQFLAELNSLYGALSAGDELVIRDGKVPAYEEARR
jgi:hypothetical protein